MKVYIYDDNGYFKKIHICQTGCFGEILFPSGNYTDIIPVYEENKIPKFNGIEWEMVINYKGFIIYNKITLEKIQWNNFYKWDETIYTDIELPDFFYKWEIDNWIIDIDKYKIKKKNEIKSLIMDNLLDINKTIDQIKTQWNNIKIDFTNYNMVQEIDSIYNNAKTWLGL